MNETPDKRYSDALRLAEELERLQEEQRTLDLRDSDAVAACQRKIDALRRQIDLLDRSRGNAKNAATPYVS